MFAHWFFSCLQTPRVPPGLAETAPAGRSRSAGAERERAGMCGMRKEVITPSVSLSWAAMFVGSTYVFFFMCFFQEQLAKGLVPRKEKKTPPPK